MVSGKVEFIIQRQRKTEIKSYQILATQFASLLVELTSVLWRDKNLFPRWCHPSQQKFKRKKNLLFRHLYFLTEKTHGPVQIIKTR